jgi:xylulokinase
MPDLMLGIDVGTSGLKVALLHSSGEMIAEAGEEYPTYYPYPNWAEQDSEDWWKALCTAVHRVMASVGTRTMSLAGICISSQAPVIVPVAVDGRPLMRGMLWLDKRAESECALIREVIGEARLSQITANNLSSYLGAPSYVWLKRNHPDLFAQTHQFLMANSYLNWRLTGRFTMDVSQAPLQLLYDVTSGKWSDEILQALDLPVEKLPPVYPCLAIIGEVRRDAADELGIPVGTPVLAGTTDTPAAMVGMGVLESGQAFISHGTGCNIGLCVSRPWPSRHIVCIPHAIPGMWMLSAVMTSSGASMRWFVSQLCPRERHDAVAAGQSPYDWIDADARTAPPGSRGLLFLPYLVGEQSPIWDPDARGAFVGISVDTTRGEMLRAIMEGVAFGIRQNLQVYLDGGWEVRDVRAQGGATKSPLWNQIVSDVIGRTIYVSSLPNSAPVGDALLVGLATGIYRNVQDLAAACPAPSSVCTPNPGTAAIYERLYRVYEGLYGCLADSFHQLAIVRNLPAI